MGNFNKRDNKFNKFGGGGRGNNRGGDRRGGFGSGGGMHQAICNECGKSCEVPFKPTQGKPIYCNDCFRNKRASEPRRQESFSGRRGFSQPRQEQGTNQTQKQLEMINQKIDKVLKLLSPDIPTEISIPEINEKKVIPLQEEKGISKKKVKAKSEPKAKAKATSKKKK